MRSAQSHSRLCCGRSGLEACDMSTDARPDPIQAQADAATARLAEMKVAYDNSPEQQLARAQEYVGRIGNDTASQVSARAEVARLQQRAEAEAAQLPDRLEAALADAPVGVSVDTTTDDELSMPALRELVADYRGIGINDVCIREAIDGCEETAAVIEEAKERMSQNLADPEWMRKLAAGDKFTRKEFVLLNVVINARVAA
jgi:hypothetical protein